MTADQILVGEVDVGGIDGTGDHARRVGEEVLVMRRLRGAVGNDQRGLAATPSPPAALGVVRGRRRHVAHVDRIQRRDVDAKLHGRRAEQYGQSAGFEALPETKLALLAGIGLDLGGVFARLELVEKAIVAVEERGHVLVKIAEKHIGRARVCCCLFGEPPFKHRTVDAVADAVAVEVFRFDVAVGGEHAQDVVDEGVVHVLVELGRIAGIALPPE